jgi:S-methylmethionine-dependent homocysteine/selenocysteine methylase
MTLAQFQYPNNRAWTIRAMHDYPEAVPKTYHEFHTPAVIRDIAEWLRLYANELEAQNAA